MMKRFLSVFFGLLICLIMIGATAWAAGDPKVPFKRMVAFGDSYSDNGFADGHGFERQTNTLTWVEYLADFMKLPLDNLAWGGAMTDNRNCYDLDWSGLNWQVDLYLKNLPEVEKARQKAAKSTLYTIMCGTNDIWGGQKDPKVAVKNIRLAAEKLAKSGAKHILFRETSAVLLSPGYLEGPYVKLAKDWRKAANEINAQLKEEVFGPQGLAAEFPEVNFYYVEGDRLMNKIKNQEPGFKFAIIDKKWHGTFEFPEPYKYLWWDEWHPMGQHHKLIAEDAYQSLLEQLKAK